MPRLPQHNQAHHSLLSCSGQSAHKSPRVRQRLRSEEHTSELQSHRDLHSFPTRRSSDLEVLYSAVEQFANETLRACRCECVASCPAFVAPVLKLICQDCLSITRRITRYCHVAASRRIKAPEYASVLDRKSTRLNSSHTEIYTLSLHDALPISRYCTRPLSNSLTRPCARAAANVSLVALPSSRQCLS